MTHEKINRNIKNNAFYMINLFNQKKERNPNKKISVTNLKLQKLMYFVEAYYMVKNPDEDEMFNEKWSAWDYGPVCKELYDQFKVFGSIEITISEEESMIGDELSKENKKYIEDIFGIFGELPAFHLVTLTHMKQKSGLKKFLTLYLMIRKRKINNGNIRFWVNKSRITKFI